MGDIKKATQVIGAPVVVPEEGPVICRDEVVTTTASSTTVTTITKTRAEFNDESTGKQITRDTTTTVEKVERNTPDGVTVTETNTSESWVKAEEGTLHFIESESTTTRSRPGSAGAGLSPQGIQQKEDHPRDLAGNQSEGGSVDHNPSNIRDQGPMVTADDSPPTDPQLLQPPPHCELQRKSTVSYPQEPPPL